MSSRYICTVLEEMRTCTKTLNFASLSSLIEEVQTLANRMESVLEDYKGGEWTEDRLRALRGEEKRLRREITKLEIRREELEDENDSD